jgi:hypothetical protein
MATGKKAVGAAVKTLAKKGSAKGEKKAAAKSCKSCGKK